MVKRVINIGERNTSKSCCCCDKKQDMSTWNRTMEFDCGHILDRDRNSAINIKIACKGEIHYRIKNNLQIISSLFYLQAD